MYGRRRMVAVVDVLILLLFPLFVDNSSLDCPNNGRRIRSLVLALFRYARS